MVEDFTLSDRPRARLSEVSDICFGVRAAGGRLSGEVPRREMNAAARSWRRFEVVASRTSGVL
jgi:hypothetical protein